MLKHPRTPRSIDGPGNLPSLPKGSPDDGTATGRQMERRKARDLKNRKGKKAKTAKPNPYYPHPQHVNPRDGKKPQITRQDQSLLMLEDNPGHGHLISTTASGRTKVWGSGATETSTRWLDYKTYLLEMYRVLDDIPAVETVMWR